MKTAKAVLWILVVTGLLLLNPYLMAQSRPAAEISLTDSSNQANFPAILQAGFRYWSNSYLITIPGPPIMVPEQAGVTLYDRDGRVARQATVWPEGAETVSLTDAAVSRSGALVVSGGATDKNKTIANFIAEIGGDDRIGRMVRTTPFVPQYICSLDDGTVWAYGFERDASMTMVQNAPRLRQYSFDKGRLQSLLDTSALPDAEASRTIWQLPHGGYLGLLNLRCNSQEVVLYNGGTGDLIEYDLQKNTMNLTKVEALPKARTFHITGFALTDSGEIFASFHDASNLKAVVSGLFRLSRNKSGGAKWVAVAVGRYLQESSIEKLWGADGERLVYSRLKDGQLFWTKQKAD